MVPIPFDKLPTIPSFESLPSGASERAGSVDAFINHLRPPVPSYGPLSLPDAAAHAPAARPAQSTRQPEPARQPDPPRDTASERERRDDAPLENSSAARAPAEQSGESSAQPSSEDEPADAAAQEDGEQDGKATELNAEQAAAEAAAEAAAKSEAAAGASDAAAAQAEKQLVQDKAKPAQGDAEEARQAAEKAGQAKKTTATTDAKAVGQAEASQGRSEQTEGEKKLVEKPDEKLRVAEEKQVTEPSATDVENGTAGEQPASGDANDEQRAPRGRESGRGQKKDKAGNAATNSASAGAGAESPLRKGAIDLSAMPLDTAPTAEAAPEVKVAEQAAPPPAANSSESKPTAAVGNGRLPGQLLQRGEGTTKAPPVSEADQARFVQRVARAFKTAQDRGGELRLRLSPPELGSLKLEVKVQQGVMHARLEAESATARSLLLENLPVLRERLAEQGIRIEQFDVELMDRQPDSPQEGLAQQQQQQRSNTPGPHRESPGRTAEEPESADAAPDARPLLDDGQLNVVI